MPISGKTVVDVNFLQNKWQAEKERQDEAQEKLDLYNDDQKEIVEKKLEELFNKENYKRIKLHVNQSQNVLKRVINEISTIYKVEPRRDYKDNERYQKIIQQSKLDPILKIVNRYTNLLNEVIIKVGVREHTITGEERIAYDILTPNICTVIQDINDPTQINAIIYRTTGANTVGSNEINYHYWDIEGSYRIFDKDFRLIKIVYDSEGLAAKEGRSPYINKKTKRYIMPFVVFHRQEPIDSFWDQDSGRDLYNATILTAVKMTLFDYYFKVASFKQPYVIGKAAEIPNHQILDPLTVFRAAGEDAQIGLLDMQINLNQLRDAIVYQVNSIINNYGISADQWTFSISEMSGIALRIRNRALLEIREEQIPYYRAYESDLFEITRIVNNAHFKEKIQESIEFSIDFDEINFPEDPIDKLKYQKSLWSSGLISNGQYYQAFNPDVDDEKEAEKKLVENLQKFENLKQKHPDLGDYLDRIWGIVDQGGGGSEEGNPEGPQEEQEE